MSSFLMLFLRQPPFSLILIVCVDIYLGTHYAEAYKKYLTCLSFQKIILMVVFTLSGMYEFLKIFSGFGNIQD